MDNTAPILFSVIASSSAFEYTNPDGSVCAFPVVGKDFDTPSLAILNLMKINGTLPDGHMGECVNRVLRGEPVYKLEHRKCDGGMWDFYVENLSDSSDFVFTDEAFFAVVQPSDVLYAVCDQLDILSVIPAGPSFLEWDAKEWTHVAHPFNQSQHELFVIDVNAPNALDLTPNQKRFLELMKEDYWDND